MNKFFIKSQYGAELGATFGTVSPGHRRYITSMSGYSPDMLEEGFILLTQFSKKELSERGLLVSHPVNYGMVS